MLPPAPAATMAFESPNACNLCHTDRDAAWADKQVREWRARDYQAPLLHRARLIDAARKRDWSKREEMLHYIGSSDRNEVFAVSLIRMIPPSDDPKILEILLKAADDPSPLVRAAAMEALAMAPSQQGLKTLAAAASDSVRLVRIRAAAALSAYPDLKVEAKDAENVGKAKDEYQASLRVWLDQWSSHFNLGNYHLDRGELKEAVACYERAIRLEPRADRVLVNASIAQARMGEFVKAEKSLQEVLRFSPENAAAHFNMGLLMAERNDPHRAEEHLKAALKYDPKMDQAAYNLCILLSGDRVQEAVRFCREATALRPDDPRYAYTLAFYLHQNGETAEAVKLLKTVGETHPDFRDAQVLLQEISATSPKR